MAEGNFREFNDKSLLLALSEKIKKVSLPSNILMNSTEKCESEGKYFRDLLPLENERQRFSLVSQHPTKQARRRRSFFDRRKLALLFRFSRSDISSGNKESAQDER